MGKTILTSLQQKILHFLSNEENFIKNFYFTGGTALSEYYLHHRLSEDLDFFSENEVDKLWLATLGKKIKKLVSTEKVDIQESFNRNLVFFTTQREVLKMEFTYFPFPQIKKPQSINNIKVDSLVDIAVNKFFTLYQKPSGRHFIDLYLILNKKVIHWEELAKLARIKFDTVIDPLPLGSQLILSRKIGDLPKMLINLAEKEWMDFFYQKALILKSEIEK